MEFHPDGYTEVEDLALSPEDRGESVSSTPHLESVQEQPAGANGQIGSDECAQREREKTQAGEGAKVS